MFGLEYIIDKTIIDVRIL